MCYEFCFVFLLVLNCKNWFCGLACISEVWSADFGKAMPACGPFCFVRVWSTHSAWGLSVAQFRESA